MKKILIVTYTFYPDNNPRSLRWQALALQFIEKGCEVHVLTQQKSELGKLKIFGRKKTAMPVGVNVTKTDAEVLQQASFRKVLIKKVRKFFKLVVWPDFSAAWMPWALYKLFILNKNNHYDLLISSSHPMSAHVPVLILKKFGFINKLKWIVDIGDPFGLVGFHNLNNQALYEKLNFVFERSVCRSADLVCVTTPQTRDLYIDGYDLPKDKVKIASPVLSLKLDIEVGDKNPYSRPYNFIFAGTLYKQIRNPKPVLAFASYLEAKFPAQFGFHFFGVLGDCTEYFKEKNENIITYGLVNQSQLRPYVNFSDAVINVGNVSQYQLPSKVVEAIASKKFIFNFCSNDNDTSTSFLQDYPGHFNISSEKDFHLALASFRQTAQFQQQIDSASLAIIKLHSPASVADVFLKSPG